MNPKNFFAALKRRDVYKVAITYAAVGWLLVQIATQAFPFLEIPNWLVVGAPKHILKLQISR